MCAILLENTSAIRCNLLQLLYFYEIGKKKCTNITNFPKRQTHFIGFFYDLFLSQSDEIFEKESVC